MDQQVRPKCFKNTFPIRVERNIEDDLNHRFASTTGLPKISSESTSLSEAGIAAVSRDLNDSRASFGELSGYCCGSSHSESSTERVSVGINRVPCSSSEGAKWTKIRQHQERNKRRAARIKRERKKEREPLKESKKKSGRSKKSTSSSSSSAASKKKRSAKKKRPTKKKAKKKVK